MTILVTQSSTEEFFREELGEAMEKERVSVSGFTREYLVQLLVRQIATDDPHRKTKAYHPQETLVDRLALALCASRADRIHMLCEVGDRALVFSGLWWEYNFRPLRPSHAKLYLDLGRRAYRAIGGIPYDELAEHMDGVVDTLIRLGTSCSLKTARDILRLYILWEETHSRCLARMLAERGLVPMESCSRVLS